jgi:hypothetical protein
MIDPSLPTADLLVRSCTGQEPALPAHLTTTGPVRDALVGAVVELGSHGRVQLQSVRLIGPGEDPRLPPDHAQLTLLISSSLSLDWPALAPTLLLDDGQQFLPLQQQRLADALQTELIYLIPAPDRSVQLLWQLSPLSGQPPQRWRIALDAPPSRAVLLRDTLVIEQVSATTGELPGMLRVAVRIRNRGEHPLLLSAETITLSAREQVLTSLDPDALTHPLAPAESRVLVLQAPEQEQLLLSVGVRRFQLEPPTTAP